MMAGLSCQMLNAAVAPPLPNWLPAGATGHSDFTGAHHFWDGASRAMDDVLSGIDPVSLASQGLFFVSSNDSRPRAVGAMLADFAAGLAAGMTLVFDFDFVNPPFGWAMYLGDAPDFESSTKEITIAVDDSMYDDDSLGLGSDLATTGRHILAVTINRDAGGGGYEYAWSLDGAAATTQTVAYAASWTLDTVALGWDGSDTDQLLDSVWLRSLTLYPAKPPADLPALTDLPTA